MKRTHNNGELRLTNVKEQVVLKGWVAKKRDLGGLVFIDLRDKEGITQLAFSPESPLYKKTLEIKSEYVLEIEFMVKAKNAWERAANVYRMSPTVTMLQQSLGLTDSQVDDIFKAAYLIEA